MEKHIQKKNFINPSMLKQVTFKSTALYPRTDWIIYGTGR